MARLAHRVAYDILLAKLHQVHSSSDLRKELRGKQILANSKDALHLPYNWSEVYGRFLSFERKCKGETYIEVSIMKQFQSCSKPKYKREAHVRRSVV